MLQLEIMYVTFHHALASYTDLPGCVLREGMIRIRIDELYFQIRKYKTNRVLLCDAMAFIRISVCECNAAMFCHSICLVARGKITSII